MSFDPKVIEALALLRNYAKHSMVAGPVCEAIEKIDNAGVFAALDEQTDYASAEEILAESAFKSATGSDGIPTRHPAPKPDPAEWGDTTAADMARHHNLENRAEIARRHGVDASEVNWNATER